MMMPRSFALSPADREQRLSLERLWADVSARPIREWSVASFARRAGYSVKHFGRLVRKHCGVSPREMIVRIRMHRAMEMLRATDVTLDAIASRLGCDTGFSFSRAFKQCAGRSPKAFRAECA